jgi:hypothetical protein
MPILENDHSHFLAHSIRYLLEGNQYEPASYLLLASKLTLCDAQLWPIDLADAYSMQGSVVVVLEGPRILYDFLSGPIPLHPDNRDFAVVQEEFKKERELRNAVDDGIRAALSGMYELSEVKGVMHKEELDPSWRIEFEEIVKGKSINNQGIEFARGKRLPWKNMFFRSHNEIKVAEALDKCDVLFLPNCMARLGSEQGGRVNREADFIVCRNGNWGIIEVDSDFSHPPSRTVDDHKRDRLFKQYGISVVEHFDQSDIQRDAMECVRVFLDLLEKS